MGNDPLFDRIRKQNQMRKFLPRSHKKADVPRGLGLTVGGAIEMQGRGRVTLKPAGKVPKRRFSPGQFITVEGQLLEIVYAYRVADNPSEWIYNCEFREEMKTLRDGDIIGKAFQTLGAGSETPRVVNELFLSHHDARFFFADIPLNNDQILYSNKQLLQKKAEVRSSGEVIDKPEMVKK